MSANTLKRVRPQRTRKASKRHGDSVQWTQETMQILRASSESSDRSSTSLESQVLNDDGDVVFEDLITENVDDEEEEEEEEEEDQDQISGKSVQLGSPAGTAHTSNSIRSKTAKPGSSGKTVLTHANRAQLVKASKASLVGRGLRNRMVTDDREIIRGNNDGVYQQNYGPCMDDLYHVLQSRDIWHVFPRDVTLPSRRSLSAALQSLPKGYLKQKAQKEGCLNGLNLPVDDRSAKSQIVQSISSDQAFGEGFFEPGSARDIVLGPWSSAQKYTIEHLVPFDISTAWTRSEPYAGQAIVQNMTDACHKGWLINTGARPQCIAWSFGNSEFQFLAVSFRCSEAQRAAAVPVRSRLAPAFSASPQYPSSLQIWQIKRVSTETTDLPSQMDFSTVPQLFQILCLKWGNILRLEWTPMSGDDSAAGSETRSLALLTSDGRIRLIDVDLQADNVTRYITYEKAKITLHPPSTTIFSAFCFACKHDIITGAADGAIRIYNLTDNSSCDASKPYLTHQVFANYIMAVAVSSELPYYVCSSSAGGDLVLSDLRSPNIDKISIHKARLPTRNLSYLPFIRTFVTTNDAAGNSEPSGTAQGAVVSHSIRHFQYTNTIMKLPDACGLTTSLATSPFHPCLLVANAQGSVFATNHIRRYLPVSNVSSTWTQKIFEYDWQPLPPEFVATEEVDAAPAYSFIPTPSVGPTKDPIDIYHGHDLQPGISRMHEGFRAERVDLSIQYKQSARASTSLPSMQVVFHEEQAVAAMVWNPNPQFAGWAAVAWGSGLLRIQDFSHDMQ